jgi:hypothetical protein
MYSLRFSPLTGPEFLDQLRKPTIAFSRKTLYEVRGFISSPTVAIFTFVKMPKRVSVPQGHELSSSHYHPRVLTRPLHLVHEVELEFGDHTRLSSVHMLHLTRMISIKFRIIAVVLKILLSPISVNCNVFKPWSSRL